MAAIILFKCRSCDAEIAFPPVLASSTPCPKCAKHMPVRPDNSLLDKGVVEKCISCGHDAFYVQKDFNRNLGLVIVVIGVLGSLYFFTRQEPFYAMASLIVMALVDLAIYSMVGEVTVCYCCHAVYRGFKKNPGHHPFELKDLEKYGGRDPRF